LLIKVEPNLFKEIKKYPYNFFINEEKNLYIYNKVFFMNFIINNNIKYINNHNDDYYYLISNNDIFKYFNSKYILEKTKEKI
jgi:hypothetical protein